MAQNDLISIIVAVYNAEKYISRCFDSIINQTYRNIEIILVDDGSMDNSGIICDSYAKTDERIRVIHKQNGGNNPLNVGVSEARGEYIGIVDDDDYIEPNMYETMYDIIRSKNAEIAICNYRYVDEDGKDLGFESPIKQDEVITGKEGLRRLSRPMGNYYTTVWNRLYKSEIIKETPIPNGCIYGDSYIAHRLLDKCKKICVIDDVLYNYTQRKGSQSRIQTGFRYFDLVESYIDRVEYYIERGYADLIPDGLNRVTETYRNSRRRMITKEKNKKCGLRVANKVKNNVERVCDTCKRLGYIDASCNIRTTDIYILQCILADKIIRLKKRR